MDDFIVEAGWDDATARTLLIEFIVNERLEDKALEYFKKISYDENSDQDPSSLNG